MWCAKKKGVDPENIKLMLGVDGGQGKLAIVPNNEMLRTCQRAQVSSVAWSSDELIRFRKTIQILRRDGYHPLNDQIMRSI